MNDALTFLEDLWPDKPPAAAVALWHRRSKKTDSFDSLQVAAEWAQRADGDIYLHAGLAAKAQHNQRGRLSIADVVGIPGLWADIDVNGGPEDKTGAAPTMEAAKEFASCIIEPTTLVMSGYGLQAWWLLDEPWLFALTPEREQAARLSEGFHRLLKQEARARGFSIDATFDLARLMRLPGTHNHKGEPPVAVELLESDGPRYTVQKLTELAETFVAKIEAKRIDAVSITGTFKTPDLERMDELCDIDSEFRSTWQRTGGGRRKEWGQSEYDMAIANHLVVSGFTDQEIADAIAYHRKRAGDPKDKASRPDYLKLTIGKARRDHTARSAKAERQADVEEAIGRMEEIADDVAAGGEGAPATVTVSLFNKVIGGPRIKELVQDGRDHEMTRYTLIFADGSELPLGTPRDLLNYDRFRERYVALTTLLPGAVPREKWDNVVRALLSSVVVRVDEDSSSRGRTAALVLEYVENRMSRDRDGAAAAGDPFIDEGDLYLNLARFAQWLRRIRGERVTEVDLKQALQRCDFERGAVNYRKQNGSRTTRSYYSRGFEGLRNIVEREGAVLDVPVNSAEGPKTPDE